ncbi:MAG TPA: DUF3747 domain-containing protein [Stenomitos sp.]
MSQLRPMVWGTVTAGLLVAPLQPSIAATFGQTEVDQNKFEAIAVPRASGYYTLLVLEQISSKKQCWRESGSKPTRIEPLLVNFNFTGICGRSTDSNGYSIRMAGKDMALNYRLSLQKQKDEVVLMGVPATSGTGKPMEIARTHGMRSGFLKLVLNPGWRFAKRSYSGKTLGHVYFTRDTVAPTIVASANGKSSALAKPVTGAAPKSVSKTATTKPSGSDSSGATSYRVLVIAPNGLQQSKLRSQRPSAFRTVYDGDPVFQVGTFGDRSKAESLQKELQAQGFKTRTVSNKVRIAQTDGTSRIALATVPKSGTSSAKVIAVPTANVPVGNTKGAKNIYTPRGYLPATLPPPPLQAKSRIRVVVVASDSQQQSKVRSLVPGAFSTDYQGKRVMQVGSFSRKEEAAPVIALMQRNGFKPIAEAN